MDDRIIDEITEKYVLSGNYSHTNYYRIRDALTEYAARSGTREDGLREAAGICSVENARNERLAFLHPMLDSHRGAAIAAYECTKAILSAIGAKDAAGFQRIVKRCSVSFQHPAHDECDGNPAAAAPSAEDAGMFKRLNALGQYDAMERIAALTKELKLQNDANDMLGRERDEIHRNLTKANTEVWELRNKAELADALLKEREGFVWVPVEPTIDMCIAAAMKCEWPMPDMHGRFSMDNQEMAASAIYKAMIGSRDE